MLKHKQMVVRAEYLNSSQMCTNLLQDHFFWAQVIKLGKKLITSVYSTHRFFYGYLVST